MALSSTERHLQTMSRETQPFTCFLHLQQDQGTSLYSETVDLLCGPVRTEKALSSEPLSSFWDCSTGRNMFSCKCFFQLCIVQPFCGPLIRTISHYPDSGSYVGHETHVVLVCKASFLSPADRTSCLSSDSVEGQKPLQRLVSLLLCISKQQQMNCCVSSIFPTATGAQFHCSGSC